MKMNLIFFIFLTTIFANSQGKYVELLPDEEKQDFLERVARRILETVQTKDNPKKYSREITDDQLREQNVFIQSILKQESEQMRRSKDATNITEKTNSEDFKVQPLDIDRIIDKEDTNIGLKTDILNLTVRDIKDVPKIGLLNSTATDIKRRSYDEPSENPTEHSKGVNVVAEYDPPMQKRSVSTDGNDANIKTGSKEEKESKPNVEATSVSGAHLNQETEVLGSIANSDVTVEKSNYTSNVEESAITTKNNNETVNKDDSPITTAGKTTIPVSIELITIENDVTTENSVKGQNDNDELMKTTSDDFVTTEVTTIRHEGDIILIKSLDEKKKPTENINEAEIHPKSVYNIQPKPMKSEEISENMNLSSKSDVDEYHTESTTNLIREYLGLGNKPKFNSPNINFDTQKSNIEQNALEKSANVTLSSNLNNEKPTTESLTKHKNTGLDGAPSDAVDEKITSSSTSNVEEPSTDPSTELTGLGSASSANPQDEGNNDSSDPETEKDSNDASTGNDSEETGTTQSTNKLAFFNAKKEVLKKPIKPKKVYKVKPNNNPAIKVIKPQVQKKPHRAQATELKKTTTKQKKVCGLLSCSEYKVFEVPADKPFLQGKSIILQHPQFKAQGSEVIVSRNSESKVQEDAGQPYFIPVYNYSPNNAYFNPQNKLGPNVVEENTIEIDKNILRGGNDKTNLEFELDLGEMRRYVGYENVDEDFSDEINIRSQKPGKQGGNTDQHIMSSDLPNSDEEMHPYNSMKHGVKSHIQAVRQILQEKRLYHAPDQPKDYMKDFFGKTNTPAYITTTEDVKPYYYETTTQGFLRPILREQEIEKKHVEKPASPEATTERHIRRKLRIRQRVYDSQEEDTDVKTINDKYLINRVKRKINSLAPKNINKSTQNHRNLNIPKNRIDAIAKILNITNKKLIVSVQKLQNKKFKRSYDNKVGLHINVLKDLIGQDRKALKQYDWLATTVQIQSSVTKLLELINRIKQSKPIHPSDLQIIKYVNFLHKQATDVLRATKIRDLLRKKLALPKNRRKKKNKILKEKGLINRVWLYLRSVLPDTTVEGLSDLEQFLKDVEDGLYDLHDALRNIALVTKYNHQNWYENLRELYLTTKPKHLREVLLHMTMGRLVGMIEYACQNGLEDDYVEFMKTNRDVAKKTLEEMVFVIRIVDDINNNVGTAS